MIPGMKIRGAEISLGPEMKSTGECLGIAKTFNEALYKAFLGAGVSLPQYKSHFTDIRHRTRGTGIYFDNIYLIAYRNELNIDKSDNVQGFGKSSGILCNRFLDFFADR